MTPEARIQRTRAWLRYSARDMNAARLLLRNVGAGASPYHAAFWAQQAAEKALKGALTYAGVPFEATHRLNALAAALPDGWETRRGRGGLTELTSYGVEMRYPDVGEPSQLWRMRGELSRRRRLYSRRCGVIWKPTASPSSNDRQSNWLNRSRSTCGSQGQAARLSFAGAPQQ